MQDDRGRIVDLVVPTFRWLGRGLSKPWVGPSISLVVLAVSITSLIYNISGYNRQTARWQAEEDDQIRLQLHVGGGLTSDGYRQSWVELYFRPTDPVRLEKLEAIGPPGITIKPDSINIVKPGTASPTSFEIDESVGPTTDSNARILLAMFLRTPQTPLDQNSIIQIKASISELSGRKRHLERQTKATIPADAKKSAQ
jgi:hypothetical protein